MEMMFYEMDQLCFPYIGLKYCVSLTPIVTATHETLLTVVSTLLRPNNPESYALSMRLLDVSGTTSFV